jgi:hypothetical protein
VAANERGQASQRTTADGGEPKKGGTSGLLGAVGGLFTAAAALFGVLAYVGLSVAADEVYSPVGVEPAEVGLNYANLLAESAVLVAVLLSPLVVTAVLLVVFEIGWRLMERWGKRSVGEVSGVGREQAEQLEKVRRGARNVGRIGAAALVVYAAVFAWLFIAPDVRQHREDLLDGKASTGSVPTPWDFHVVTVRWLDDSKAPRVLPDCMLYLGRGDGTDVFYAHRSEQTLRLPASAIYVEARRNDPSC